MLHADAGFGRQWMDHYSQNPQPQELISAVLSLDQDGYFQSAAQRDSAIGFLSVVLRQNPNEVAFWLRTSNRVLSEQPRRILAAAAWFAGRPEAGPQLQKIAFASERAEIDRLVADGRQADIAAIPVSSEPAMNLQFGAYLASGDQRYIGNIFAAFGSNEPGLTNAARYTLARNAVEYPRVLEACRSELARQPSAVRAQFEAALNAAIAQKPGA